LPQVFPEIQNRVPVKKSSTATRRSRMRSLGFGSKPHTDSSQGGTNHHGIAHKFTSPGLTSSAIPHTSIAPNRGSKQSSC